MKYSAIGRLARLCGMAGIACGAVVPLAATAELSDETMIGLGLRSRPAFDGSASQNTELVPVLRHFGKTFFVRSTQGVLEGGARLEIAPGLRAGAQIAYEPGRRTGDADFLASHRVTQIGRGASLGLHMEWDRAFGPVPVSLLARVRKNIDASLGTQADLRASVGVLHTGPFSAGVFAQTTWADAKAANALYGIAPSQTAVTGLPAYQPGSGRIHASLGLIGSVELGPRWLVVGSLEERRLHGDAADSPLVQQSSNRYLSLGLAYRY